MGIRPGRRHRKRLGRLLVTAPQGTQGFLMGKEVNNNLDNRRRRRRRKEGDRTGGEGEGEKEAAAVLSEQKEHELQHQTNPVSNTSFSPYQEW